jgi:hypothetical protein
MLEYTFRNAVENVRRGETNRFATNSAARPGDLLMLVSGRHQGIFNVVERQPDENPIRAVVEVSKVEAGPPGFQHFIRWDRLVFGPATPTFQAEVAFDRAGHPRYSRLVAISKHNDEGSRPLSVIDLEDGEVLTTNLDRLTRTVQPEGCSATVIGD